MGHCTEVRFVGFTTMTVINPPERNWQNAPLCTDQSYFSNLKITFVRNYRINVLTFKFKYNFWSTLSFVAFFDNFCKRYEEKLMFFFVVVNAYLILCTYYLLPIFKFWTDSNIYLWTVWINAMVGRHLNIAKI